MTDAPWTLPPQWHWAEFQDVARVASNLVDPADFSEMQHIAPNHIEAHTGHLFPTKTVTEDAVTSAKHRFRAGQVLYSKIRPYLAKVVIAPYEGLCSADMYPIDTDLDPRYLKWWMLTPEFTRRAAGQQARTILPKINKKALGLLPVPVVSRSEQERIVGILEDYLSRLNAASTLERKAAARLVAYQRATLSAVIDRPERRRSPLGALVKRIEAGRSFGGSSAPADLDQWGIIKVSAMTWGRFAEGENKAVPAELADPRYEIRSGDLLVSRANTASYVGASVLVDGVRPRLLLSDKSLRIVPADSINAQWLQLALSSPSARAQISAKATGTKDSMRNISQSSLLSITVPHVDLTDQAADVARITEHVGASKQLQAGLVIAGRRQEALRRALFTAAFSGQLTDRRKDMEFVEELATVGAAS